MKPANPFSLDGKTAVVAGASRGIGQAIAEALARAGARTILASRSVEKLAALARDLQAQGLQAEAMELDIASHASRLHFAGEVPDTDILINVAGTNIRRNFTDYTPEEYSFLLETNLTGIVELTQAVGKRMIARGKGGKVVMIGSLSSLDGHAVHQHLHHHQERSGRADARPRGRVGPVQHSGQLHRAGLHSDRPESQDVGGAGDAGLAAGRGGESRSRARRPMSRPWRCSSPRPARTTSPVR